MKLSFIFLSVAVAIVVLSFAEEIYTFDADCWNFLRSLVSSSCRSHRDCPENHVCAKTSSGSTCILLVNDPTSSYSNTDDWKNEYPNRGGSEQSPLDIRSTYDIIDKSYNSVNKIHFENYDTLPEKMIVKNDGHTLKVIYKWADGEKKIPQVFGGSLEVYYILHSIQFRWGSDLNSGSEHFLTGKSFPVEVQLVHYDEGFDNYEDAEEYETGILIHSSFFEIGSEENEFLTKIPEVIQPETATEIEPFSIEILYKTSAEKAFIVYYGSLTYPPCSETVVWMISNKVFFATEEQMQLFHTLKLMNDDDHNNRPLQKINGRKPLLQFQRS